MDQIPPSMPSGPVPGRDHGGPAPRRILGIDPGSRTTGYAVIDSDGNHSIRVSSGCIRVGHESWPGRLGLIFNEVALLVRGYAPQEMAVEQLIFARDPVAALKLGQARGAIICAALQGGVQVHEYSPKSVKQAVVGTGAAEKSQVQHMVRILLALDAEPTEDEADALALALCHAHSLGIPARRRAAASWRDWRPTS
jgi:crossover junction endodeoxyribonuclease RuvC